MNNNFMFLLISENNKLCLFTCIHMLQRLLHIIQIIDRLSIYTAPGNICSTDSRIVRNLQWKREKSEDG